MNKLKRCSFCGRHASENTENYMSGCHFCNIWADKDKWNNRPLEDELLEALISSVKELGEYIEMAKMDWRECLSDKIEIIEKHKGKPIDEVVK